MTAATSLEQGRAAFERQAWGNAYQQLTAADRETGLDPEDLERLAIAAHLVGRDAESTDVWARAHHAFLGRGAAPGAARCAFWLGFTSLIQGEPAQSGGWLARGQRLLDDGRHDCVERGYLVLLQAVRSMFAGDDATFHAAFDQAARIGERFGDPQLVAFGRLGVGAALIRSGQTAQGLALLDEAMVSVTAGEVSPIGVGIVLLRGGRAMPADLRPAPGQGVDEGARPVVRVAGGPRALSRPVPGAPRRDHAAAGGLAGCHARGPAGVRAALPDRRTTLGRWGLVPVRRLRGRVGDGGGRCGVHTRAPG